MQASDETAQTLCVPPFCADAMIVKVRELLMRAAERSKVFYNEPSILIDLRSKALLLWIAVEPDLQIVGAALTRVMKEGGGLSCVITLMGGRGNHDWGELTKRIEEYARDEGCTRMRIEGRSGWKRKLAATGYVQTGVILCKEMTHGR